MEERGSKSPGGAAAAWSHWQRIFPLVDEEGRLCGILTRAQMIAAAEQVRTNPDDAGKALLESANLKPATMSPFDTLRSCATAMAQSKITSYPVVAGDGKLLGVMTIEDVLKGRSEQAHRESDRERVIRLRWPFSGEQAEEKLPEDDVVPVP
jgi:CBS domain-containing protein